MGESSHTLHEEASALDSETVDRHRALVSLQEELEAVDWYDQRVQAATNPELRAILEHNRDEEKEHAAMILEWLRRNDSVWDEELRTYLMRTGSIIDHGQGATEVPSEDSKGLGIGSLRTGGNP